MSEEISTIFPDWVATVGIPLSAVAGVIFAALLWYRVSLIRVRGGTVSSSETGREYLLEEEQQGEGEVRVFRTSDPADEGGVRSTRHQ